MMNDSEQYLETKIAGVNPDSTVLRTGWHDQDEPLTAIAERVAAFLNERPTELPPLGNIINGDALRDLLACDGEPINMLVSFSYQGLEITITGAEILIIEPTEPTEE